MKSIYAVTLALILFSAFQAIAQTQIDYIAVKTNGSEDADRELLRRLADKAQFNPPQFMEYSEAIRELVERNKRRAPYLARMTPYAYVAAEMLGAEFDVMAVYKSKATNSTTYHSYFVVKNGPDFQHQPTLEQVLAYLRTDRRKFIYHDKFSTSSYFLPSLYFRSHRIFATADSDDGLTAIDVQQASQPSSAFLVEEVAAGHANVAAVWDGVKVRYQKPANAEDANVGSNVWFAQLPTAMPNDLLVCSTSLKSDVKKGIQTAVAGMAIQKGDFLSWERVEAEASSALAELERAAMASPARVTVSVTGPPEKADDPLYHRYLRIVQQAIRLSGTEFEVFKPDFHQQKDVVWSLRLIHDGAVVLTSDIRNSDLPQQVFQISFDSQNPEEDLSKRIAELIDSRMHRIRYVWPYWEQYPTVIRDVDFSPAASAQLKVQRIVWKDPEKNYFDPSSFRDARVDKVDFYKFTLRDYPFPKNPSGTSLAFDPMSNVAYKVILVRPSMERMIFKVLVVAFVLLLLAGGAGAVIDLRRKPKPVPVPPRQLPGAAFERTYHEMVADSRRTWQARQIAENNLVWCDRTRIEEIVEELKTRGFKLGFDDLILGESRWRFLLKVPFLDKFVDGGVGTERTRRSTVDPKKVGDAARLASLIPFLIEKQQLSPFAGDVSEWNALNCVAHSLLGSSNGLGSLNGDRSDHPCVAILRPDEPHVLDSVSTHFSRVLTDTENAISFFPREWRIEQVEERYLLSSAASLPANIKIGKETVQGLRVEFHLPRDVELPDKDSAVFDAWLLAEGSRQSFRTCDGMRYLCLHFKSVAILGN